MSYSGTLFHELEPKQTEMSLEPLETYSETDRRKKIGEKIDKLFSPICDSNPFDKRETQVVQNALRDIGRLTSLRFRCLSYRNVVAVNES